MKRSTDAIITTHTGSLPRPDDLVDLLYAQETGEPVDAAAMANRVRSAVAETVRQQVDSGIDVVSDGEMSKISYSTYVTQRLTGFDTNIQVQRRPRADVLAFPRYGEWMSQQQRQPQGASRIKRFACCGPVKYVGQALLQTDISNLQSALAAAPTGTEAFMTAASPGVISWFQPNQYYRTEAEYLEALADAMREEYEAIYRAGLIVQLDCPDIALSCNFPGDPTIAGVGLRIEALNHAVAGIPADRMRLHLCWGNYEGPHQTDVPLIDLLGEVLLARPMGLSFEGANPRHEHEYTVFADVRLPPDKVIIPGVLDTTTNYIEHPELVAQRLVRYAELVRPEQVMAGADCGFGTFAGPPWVHPDIVFAKLQSMVEGAAIASRKLFA